MQNYMYINIYIIYKSKNKNLYPNNRNSQPNHYYEFVAIWWWNVYDGGMKGDKSGR